MTETKICYACKQEKPVSMFYRSNIRYYQKECKECCKDRKYAWSKTQEGKDSGTRTKLKARFGITVEQYNEMLVQQQYLCAICDRHEHIFTKKLAVDHCHTTGTIRGLLCRHCNLALGNMEDIPSRLRAAADYLERIREPIHGN